MRLSAQTRFASHVCFALLIVAGLFWQLTAAQVSAVGWALFGAYVLVVGRFWQHILYRGFGLKKQSFVAIVLAWVSVFLFLSLAEGVMAVWYITAPHVTAAVYGVIAVLSATLSRVMSKKVSIKKIDERIHLSRKTCISLPKVVLFAYGGLWLVGVFMLTLSSSSAVLLTPWSAIPMEYLFIYFATLVLVGLMLVSKYTTTTLLVIIIMQSLLQHAYLPLSHHQPWGGDVWRTMAVEQTLAQGDPVLPVLFGPSVVSREIFGWSVPEAFLIPNKYVYGQLWGGSVLLAQTLRVTIPSINIWLIPILWSLMLPLVLYRIGRLLFGHGRYSVWFSALSLLPFTFQALGGLTLGVSLGTLMFLYAFMLLLYYMRDRSRQQLWLLVTIGVLMIFSYTLQAIFLFVAMATAFFLIRAKKVFRSVAQRKEVTAWKWIFGSIAVILAAGFFPMLEIATRMSRLPQSVAWYEQGKHLVGTSTGWFFARSVQPYDSIIFNVFFNHTPSYAFVSSVFTNFRWHVFFLTVLASLCICVGLMYVTFREKRAEWQLMGLLAVSVFSGYVIGWFVLVGDRSFIRRLDSLMAFFMMSFVLYAIARMPIVERIGEMKIQQKRGIALLVVLLLSWFGTSVYASGPDMRVISDAEVSAAAYLWGQGDAQCVLADTWVLLALETASSGSIVGGGFPIDYQFGQPERVRLYRSFLENPSEDALNLAFELTGIDHCYVVLSSDLEEEKRLNIAQLYGLEYMEKDGLSIVHFGLKNSDE